MYIIRQAAEHDISHLQAMQREGWEQDYVGYMPESYASVALQRYGTTEAIARAIANYRYYFVCEQAGERLGCVAADHTSDSEAELYWIHVAQRHRGRGLGRDLVEYLASSLEPSITTLFVTTFQNYMPTLAFYQALGFTEHDKKITDYDGVAVNDIKLKRTLSRENI
ncbi:MAG: GNAT family N-acetyltransferase [Deinococcota bacterium]